MPNNLRDYLELMRIPAVFTALSNILAAQLIVNNGRVEGGTVLLLSITSACLYLAGMILNDCFDFQEDRLERPERTLPSGRISLKNAWLLGWMGLASGLGFALLIGAQQLLIAAALSILIVFYNAKAKKQIYGFLIMGACRYCNWLLGLSTADLGATSFLLATPIFIYVSSLTLLSTIETTAKSKKYIFYCGIGMIFDVGLILFMQWNNENINLIVLLAFIAGILQLSKRFYALYRNFSINEIQQTVKYLVMGIVPLDALVVASSKGVWLALMVLFLMIPGSLLARRLRVT